MSRFSKIIIFSILFLIFTTYLPNTNTRSKSIFFPVKEILVENNNIIEPKQITNSLQFLIGKNLLFIDKEKIKTKIDKIDFVSSFYVKKIYPSTVKIIINEKIPIGIFLDGMDKFFITKNGKLIKYFNLNNNDEIPQVYGKKNNFHIFYKKIESIGLNIEEIKSFFFFEIGRWDIVFKNNKVIKLPVKNYEESLKNFMLLKEEKSFEKYKIFDYRISDQLILK